MILKIDLEKTFDKISWDFLKQTIVDFNLPNKWINLIMHCVSTSNLKVLMNGEPCDNIKPGRGFRQCDPFPLTCLFYVWKGLLTCLMRNE